jgi:hypothetical protein
LQRASAGVDSGAGQLPDVAVETSLLRGRKRASFGTQFRILSGRAFKNLYRDPALLMAHYLSSIGLACELYLFPLCDRQGAEAIPVICGLFFHNVTYDLRATLTSPVADTCFIQKRYLWFPEQIG